MAATAVVAGGTGLVGSAVLRHLAREGEFERVVALVRREVELPDGVEPLRVDFDQLGAEVSGLRARAALCALGTTIGKAGSKEAFRRVDRDYVVAFARAARAGGATVCIAVSSIGADAPVANFYLRTKAEAEAALAALEFPTLHLVRPGLLLGDRGEHRLLEGLAQRAAGLTNALMLGPLRRFRAISADDVGAAMAQLALDQRAGVHVHHYDELRRAGS